MVVSGGSVRFFRCPPDTTGEATQMTEKLFRADVLAEVLDTSTYRVYEMAREGLIPTVRIGRQVRFDPVAIRQWIESGGTARPRS
jgi:excisionase family DNA binding protein